MTSIERAENWRDQVEMELIETESLLNMMLHSSESTQADVEKMQDQVERLKHEHTLADGEVKISRLEEGFRNLSRKELTMLANREWTDWKVKEAALRVKDWKDERRCERKVS